jgi:hypothetical protein
LQFNSLKADGLFGTGLDRMHWSRGEVLVLAVFENLSKANTWKINRGM